MSIPKEITDIESERAMLRVAVEAAVQGFSQKVVGASLGGHLRFCWWTTKVKAKEVGLMCMAGLWIS